MKWIEIAYRVYAFEAHDGEVLARISVSSYDGTAKIAESGKEYTSLAAAKLAVETSKSHPSTIAAGGSQNG